jgi:hypothetical protein
MTLPELAMLRRKNYGAWHVEFVVEGYDEEFVIRVPGKAQRLFAEEYARFGLWRTLRKNGDRTLKREHIILKGIKKGTA